MAKKHRLNKWEAQHKRNIARYEKQITELFREAVREAASLTPLLANFSPDKPFSFADYPITHQRVDELLKRLKNGVESAIANGVRSEWTLANNKNNELCNQVFGDNIGSLTHEQYERYYSTNPQAAEAFINRKEQGLNLSDRVWKYTDQFKEEIELGLDLGLREGLSADAMSRQLRSFLNHPDALFRRVRDEHGMLRLSKAAKAFHPGRGVYRSAYKNARRLAATESNIAYRTADYERWQRLDFVVGIRVVLSNNHTLNGEPFYDICDRLSAPMGSKATKGRGCYPKDFKFTGWHPLCRCHTETILKTLDEMKADEARILAGEPVSTQSENSVDDVPQEFKDWIEDNKERIERAKSLPYFIRDNFRNINIGKRFPEDLKILFNNYDNLENHSTGKPHYGAAMKLGRKAAKEAQRIIVNIGAPNLTIEQQRNIEELANKMRVPKSKIKPMTFLEADEGASNPFKDNKNCQSCVVAFSARRRGLNCVAGIYDEDVSGIMKRLGDNFSEAWINPKTGKTLTPTILRGANDKEIIEKLKKQLSQPGEYVLGINPKKGDGHVVSVFNDNGKIIIHDEQATISSSRYYSIDAIVDEMDYLELIRVDRAILNINLVKQILRVH